MPKPEQINWDAIEAKPLTTTDFTKVVGKNPNLAFFWANRMNGEPRGRRILELESAGFRVAKPEDCDVPGLKPTNGQWIYGDLILLCISRDLYLGHMKYNQQTAIARVSPAAIAAKGLREAGGMTTKMLQRNKLSFLSPEEVRESVNAFNQEVLQNR